MATFDDSNDQETVGVALDGSPGGQITARLQRTLRDAATLMERALSGLGYTGPWKLRPINHVSPIAKGCFMVSRVEPDGVSVRIQPGGNDSCWNYVLKAPSGTSPLVFEQLKRDLRLCKDNGDVPKNCIRTPKDLRRMLLEGGVSLSSAVAATGAEHTQVAEQPGSLAPRSPDRLDNLRRRRQTQAESLPPPKEPAVKPAPKPSTNGHHAPVAAPVVAPAHGDDIAGQLLARKRKVAEFRADMAKLEERHAEQHTLRGELEVAKEQVARVERGLAVVDQEIRCLNNKWPNPESMVAEEDNLKKLAAELRELMS